MQKKLPDPTPYSCVVLITSGLSHAILVLLNGFGAVNCCMDPALPLQIKLTVVSPLLLFLATITLILSQLHVGWINIFCVMFVVTVAKYKVKIYTLILEVILFKRISYWS